MKYSIGQLCKDFALSRSTLLYYDKIGILKPSGRTHANYREYTQEDYQRLNKIMLYRETGMPLQSISQLLENNQIGRVGLLEAQIKQINKEIKQLKKQQRLTIELLQSYGIDIPSGSMNKAQWVELLTASGMSDDDMRQWHIEFERLMPKAHQDFLESLNIPANEINSIRSKSKKGYQ